MRYCSYECQKGYCDAATCTDCQALTKRHDTIQGILISLKVIVAVVAILMVLNGLLSVFTTLASTDQRVFKIVSAQAAVTPYEALERELTRSPQSVDLDDVKDTSQDSFCFQALENIDTTVDGKPDAGQRACLKAGWTVTGLSINPPKTIKK